MPTKTEPMRVLIPYTVPVGFDYAKGSGRWLETLSCALKTVYEEKIDVYIMGPSYEKWDPEQYRNYPARVLPIFYQPPASFPESSRWRKEFPGEMELPPKYPWMEAPRIDVQMPIHTFTENRAYTLTKEAEGRAFRALTEVTRWRMDFSTALFGFKNFDAIFPQHTSWNLIIAAPYSHAGKALGICHETCVREGWKNRHLRPHIRYALNEQDGTMKLIAISVPVEEQLTLREDGPQLESHLVEVKENPFNDAIFKPVEGVTKGWFLRLIEAASDPTAFTSVLAEIGIVAPSPEILNKIVNNAENLKVALDLPTSGRWATFVGRTAEFKGIEQLLRSWAQYITDNESAKDDVLILVGKELTPDSAFGRYAEELGVKDNVRFIGPHEPVLINLLHNAGDVFAMSSLREGDGVVVKEAAAAGIPVLVPHSGGPGRTVKRFMGRKFISRDTEINHELVLQWQKRLAAELLKGKSAIRWGKVELDAPGIVREYVRWREHYDSGIKDPDEQKRLSAINSILLAMVDNWDSEKIVKTRDVTAAYLEGSDFLPSSQRGPATLLIDVFKSFAGMKIEADSFTSSAGVIFSKTPEERARIGQRSSKYVTESFSSVTYGTEIGKIFEKLAKRPPPHRPESEKFDWDTTTLSLLKKDENVEKAFNALQGAKTYGDLVRATAAFDRSVVEALGNPVNYPHFYPKGMADSENPSWPSAIHNAMAQPDRSEHVAARLAGVDASILEKMLGKVRSETSDHPPLQEAFYELYHGNELNEEFQQVIDQTVIGSYNPALDTLPVVAALAGGAPVH